MIEIHTWPTANGHKIHIMLEEIRLPYTVVPVNIRTGEQFNPGFLEISPNNKIPVLVDSDGPDGKSFTLFESGAILVYLSGKTGKLMPSAARDKYQVLQWVMFQMASIGPMMGQANHFRGNAAPQKIDYAINRYSNEVKRLHAVLEKQLVKRDWIAGAAYSIADIAVFPWLRASQRVGIDWTDFPNLKAWFDRIAARPAVQRALKVLEQANTSPPGQYDPRAREVLFGATQYQKR